MIIALTIGILIAGGVYLVLQRGMVRIVFGMTLISHAVNLIILSAGVPAWREQPFGSTPIEDAADPLPQAFVLTAIVITMAVTAFMLTLAALGTNDDTKRDKKRDGAVEDGAVPNNIVALTSDNVAVARDDVATASGGVATASDGDVKRGDEA